MSLIVTIIRFWASKKLFQHNYVSIILNCLNEHNVDINTNVPNQNYVINVSDIMD
jgi:hypothetical protein